MNESEAYSAKAARAGKDIGKPGKNFEKIAAKAAKRYGSEERGKKVAGAILRNLRMKEDLAYLHTLEYLDQENIELESLSEEQINELLAGFRQRKVNRLEKKADQLERINKAKSRIRAAKRVSRQNSKVRKVGRAIGKALFGSSAVRPKPAASAKPRSVAKPAVKPVSSVRPKPKKLGEEQVKKESLTYSKFSQFLRNEESGYTNIGGARVKNDEKSVLQHIQKTFPNVKKVKKDSQHGWSPVFKEATKMEEVMSEEYVIHKGKHAPGTKSSLGGQTLHGVSVKDVYTDKKEAQAHADAINKGRGYKTGDEKNSLYGGVLYQVSPRKGMKEEVGLEENYRVLATKGIGAERKEDIKVGHGVDYYHPKDGSKHMGKIHSMNDKGYVVRDDKTGEKHKFQYYRRMEEEVEHVDEMNKSGYSPGWMLKADPKLGKKVKDKITLAKLRQKAYGDPSAGKSVMKKEEVEQVDEKAPPGKKYERMVKHIKKGYEGDGLTKQEKGIAYATAWKSYNKGK